jgi:hypothetical protein
MKKIIIILFSLILSFSLTGQQPESDAIYEKIIKEYTLHEDGSMDYRCYKKLKLNTHFSFNRLYGETFIVYNRLMKYYPVLLQKLLILTICVKWWLPMQGSNWMP